MSWPRFDGPQYNRISREGRLDLRWSNAQQPSADTSSIQLWSIPGLPGSSTPLILNGKLYVSSLHTVNEKQKNGLSNLSRISCWDISDRDHELAYQYEISQFALDKQPLQNSESGTRQEPLLTSDSSLRQLFCLTWQGELHTIDSDLGHLLWKKSLSKIVNQKSSPVSIAAPLLFEHCLVVPASWYDSKKQRTTSWLLSLDRRNGQVIWAISDEHESFPSELPAPIPAVYRGQIVVVFQLKPGEIQLLQIRTGKQVAAWKLSDAKACVQELLFESEQLAVLSRNSKDSEQGKFDEASSYQWTADLFALPAHSDSVSTPENGTRLAIANPIQLSNSYHATALLCAGHFYVINSEGQLRQYQASSGKLLAQTMLTNPPKVPATTKQNADAKPITSAIKNPPAALPQPTIHYLIYADNQLLVTSSEGLWCGLAPETKKTAQTDANAVEKSVLTLNFQQQVEGVVSLPVISQGRVYVRQPGKLIAMGSLDNLNAVSEILEPLSILAQEKKSTIPGGLLITPRRQTLKPGWKQSFQVQLYSDQGAFLRTLSAEELQWGDVSLGIFDKTKGTYLAPATFTDLQGVDQIEVRYQSFSAQADIRIATE
ncbi:MAG: PQQ-binding-like beta-propeller repeat protein [Planctomycetaceae bacterium]|nr:PQQ-binding-like beta-propeller repeat protein [Planctomycetaceae bacterium]